MTPEQSEAKRLLKAAQSDLKAVRLLSTDPDQGAEVIGFHAQQAVEKSLKAVLVISGYEIPFTHDLSYLLDLCGEQAVAVPERVQDSDWLTPWAVAARYGATLGSLDRPHALETAAAAVTWASAALPDATES